MSHDTAPQDNKMLHHSPHSVLIGFGTCHEFQNELMTSTSVPLYLRELKFFKISWKDLVEGLGLVEPGFESPFCH